MTLKLPRVFSSKIEVRRKNSPEKEKSSRHGAYSQLQRLIYIWCTSLKRNNFFTPKILVSSSMHATVMITL